MNTPPVRSGPTLDADKATIDPGKEDLLQKRYIQDKEIDREAIRAPSPYQLASPLVSEAAYNGSMLSNC